MDVTILTTFIDKIEAVTKKPEKYLSLQEDEAEEIKKLTKSVYDYTKKSEKWIKASKETLDKLIIQNLDEEQIWQQVELQNNVIIENSVNKLANFFSLKENLKFPLKRKEKKPKKNGVEKEKSPVHDKEEDGLSDEENSENEVNKKEKKKKIKKVKSSIVDDKFFKLHEMEEFLEKMEKEDKIEDGDDEDEINYFSDDSTNSNEGSENQFHYNDFFDQPEDENDSNNRKRKKSNEDSDSEKKTKKVKFCLENEEDAEGSNDDELDESNESEKDNDEVNNFSDEDGIFDGVLEEEEEEDEGDEDYENDEENVGDKQEQDFNQNVNKNSVKEPSTFEARQERLKSRISALEEEALQEKSWQLKGEVTAHNRPQNSLLQEYVEFDVATRPAPVITEKSTLKLEDIIIQRIKDKAWDDVVRKIKPSEHEIEYRKKLVLDQEKSKLSLAQIYEQEYLKQLENKSEDPLDKPEVEPPEHVEIKNLMKDLFAKLDALANFHFTPKPVEAEVKIVSNLPAITMEEVAPVATSDAALLAPEEIKAKSKGELIGKSERTATDKKRERRKKKLKQKLKHQALEAKAKAKVEDENNKNLNNKKLSQKLLQKITKSSNVTQLDESGDGKLLKSSKTFFSKLQDETNSKIKKKSLDLNKPKLGKKFKFKKFKLGKI